MRILLVEDHEIVRHGVRQILAAAMPEAAFGEARDCAEATGLLVAERWDLVILDLNLPGRSGLELLRDLRTSAPGTPVLVVSAYPEQEAAVRCLREGAAGYLAKGSAAAELVAAARKLLAGGRYVSAALAEQLAEFMSGQVDQPAHEALSPRELQVLRLVAQGRSSREIGEQLHLSEKTVATYRARLGEKLGTSGTAGLVRYALKHRLGD